MAELDTGGIAAEHGLTDLAATSPPAPPKSAGEEPEPESEDDRPEN